MTAWRRLHDWQRAVVWEALHRLLLERLQVAGEIDWSRAAIDASYVQAKKEAPNSAGARSIEAEQASSSTS